MKILLTAINAKYIHSNLAVYSLQAYAKREGLDVCLLESTINQRTDEILKQIYLARPELLAFSCYIWNIDYVLELAEEYHKLCPDVSIWCGGPEVSFRTEEFLKAHPCIAGVMMGEGERTFAALGRICESGADAAAREELLQKLDGISFVRADGTIQVSLLQTLLPMDDLPFCYGDLSGLEHRILYYESSRGCPFRCTYCLSSVDKTLRFRSLPLVFHELQFFLDHRVRQVKFVDRTFNCREDHALAIWRYISEHDNGITNFHFEVSADLLTESELELIAGMRPGLIQLEIGVQSTNEQTIREIQRTMRLPEVERAVAAVKKNHNIHQHLDLIAGLPYEDYPTFQKSFDDIYAWKPDQLQLGFLKVLKGSCMYDRADEYGILYRTKAPYEVLSTRWLSYDEMIRIHSVEEMLELHYNSGQFRTALSVLEESYDSAFVMYLELAQYYEEMGYSGMNHSRVKRTEIFYEFCVRRDPANAALYRDALMFDLYRIENSKSRPAWSPDLSPYHRRVNDWIRGNGLEKKYCHAELFRHLDLVNGEVRRTSGEEENWILFDYEKRDVLTNAARTERMVL